MRTQQFGVTFAPENTEKDNKKDVKKHPTRVVKMCNLGIKKKGKKIMRRMMKKIGESKKFNNYCMNVLRMYGYGNVNIPA